METIWRLGKAVLSAVGFVILLPFALIDLVCIDLPFERRARKWREAAKIGDKVVRERHGRVYTIKKLERRDARNRKARIEYQGWGVSSSSWHPLDRLYPAPKSH